MSLRMPSVFFGPTIVVLICPGFCTSIKAQLILNEANAVGAMHLVDTDPGKPYEGYDYGVVPYSGNTNSPTALVDPGNPFPPDLDDETPGNQTTLPNGWNLAQATGWARILGNGGDWLEFVVTEDHTDLRGYTLYWENDDGPVNMIPGENPDERGFVKFTDNKAFADLRAGTVITLSEDSQIRELRDKYPDAPAADDPNLPGPAPHDTGHVYDLSTNTAFDPFTADDWHIHFHVDESQTDQGIDTDYFAAFSDIKVDNDDWRLFILDATNTSAQAQAEDVGVTMVTGLDVGRVQGPIGEAEPDFGANIPGGAGSVNGQELMTLRADPSSGLTAADYEDVDFSSFGMPNVFNDMIESNLDGTQDFSALRTPVLDDTFEWTAAGTAAFGAAANWQNASTQTPAASGPQPSWTVVLNNSGGADRVAEVTANATIGFARVMADAGTMTLRVQSGAALTVQNAPQPARILVMSGGALQNNGSVSADVVEAFGGGTVSGSGTITGQLINTAGEVAPGDGVGRLTVSGDFQQGDSGVLAIEMRGILSGQYDTMQVGGAATLDGALDISLVNGFQPTTTFSMTVLTAASVSDLGLTLSGSTTGFSVSVVGGNQLVLSFMGSGVNADFNGDGNLDCLDVDALVGDIAAGNNSPMFDLTGDGQVNGGDLDQWLADAGAANLPSGASYLVGDANLDGSVDGSDFGIWNANKFSNVAAWCLGDFSADGSVDGSDFGLWNTNKFQAADGAHAVPEPVAGLLGAIVMLWAARMRRKNLPGTR